MKQVARLFVVVMVFVTLVIFYTIGIDRFPDYENYLRIAEGSGFAVSQSDYLFEWVSRLLLRSGGATSEDRVDTLALINQLICVSYFAWLILKRDASRVYGALLLFCLFGFLFMTTTLRASAAYLCISAFFVRNARFDLPGSLLLLLSIAWHDSAAPVVVICFGTFMIDWLSGGRIFQKNRRSIFLNSIVLSSALLVLSAEVLRPVLPSFGGLDFGVRAEYLESDGGHSFSKTLFLMFAIYSCYEFVNDVRQSCRVRIFVVLMVLAMAMLNVVNGIMAVRFSFFVFAVILPLRGVFIYRLEEVSVLRIYAIVFSPLIFLISVAYVLSNTI